MPQNEARGGQFRLGSLLFVTTVVCAIFGVCRLLDIGFGAAIFAIGLMGVMLLMAFLAQSTSRTNALVHQANSLYEATFLRDVLIELGVPARIREGDMPPFQIQNSATEILVAPYDLERAKEIIAEQLVDSDGKRLESEN